jgi:hypothetical protein
VTVRVATWEFVNMQHPLYERPPDVQAWPFTPPELRMAAPLEETERGTLVERLEMEAEAWPGAVRVVREGIRGPTVQVVQLQSRYARWIDLSQVLEIAGRWLEGMRQLSRGPYTLRQLARMGHPYGWGPAPGWLRFLSPRRIPRMGRHAFVRGIRLRGAMPDRAVINLQTGRLYESWRMEWRRTQGGLELRFVNDAPYAWYLARGTIRMQAHGPWGPIVQRLMPALVDAWRRAALEAWRQRAARAGQFGRGR